jgi:hypothetical protein
VTGRHRVRGLPRAGSPLPLALALALAMLAWLGLARAQAPIELQCVGQEQHLVADVDALVTTGSKPLEWTVRVSFEPPMLQLPGVATSRARLQGELLVNDQVASRTRSNDADGRLEESGASTRLARLNRRTGELTVLRSAHVTRYAGPAAQPTASTDQVVQWQSLRCRGAPF